MEETTLQSLSVKKRKLLFTANNCLFCNKKFIKQLERTELNPLKFDALLGVCKNRTDELSINIVTHEDKIRHGVIKIYYHKACRSKFMHPFYNKQTSETEEESLKNDVIYTPSKSTRFQLGSSFLWKECCFICGGKCNTKNRLCWSRVEGSIDYRSKLYSNLLQTAISSNDNILQTRLLSTNGDLVAVEARYHRHPQCLSKYLLKKFPADEKSDMFKACLMLKSELKDQIDNDKITFDLRYLRTKLIAISRENSLYIPDTMLRACRVKEALLEIWPNLKFVAREGLSDLVCSQGVTVDKALVKSVQLQKSLNDITEQNEFETILSESINDSDANELSVVHEAAAILRRRIMLTEGLDQEYFSSMEIGLTTQRDFLDPLLVRFITWLGSESKLKDGHDGLNDSGTDQRTVSICSDITALVKSIITPKHLGLSIYLHHSYGSKKLIEDLHSHGYTLSYTEVRHFLTSAAIHMASVQERTLSGGIIPAHMSRDEQERSDDLIILAADNWDHNESTLTGKKSTHAMTSILVHTPLSDQQSAPRIPRVKERSIDTLQLPGDGLAHTLVYQKPTERPNPQLRPPVQMSELSSPEPADAKQLRLKDIMYTVGRYESLFPPWTVFQSNVQTDTLTYQSEIVFNPIIMASPTELNTVYTTLKRSKEQVNALGQTECPIVFDMGLLCKALEIVWANPIEFQGVIPLEGGMHFLMSVFGGIGRIYGDAGLKNLLVESDVFAKNTADHILSGKDFDRALRAIIMVDEVLSQRFLFQFYKWGQQNSQLVPISLLQRLQQLVVRSADTGLLQETTTLIENNMVPLMELFRQEGRTESELFQFWDDYLMKVSKPLKLYLAASRHGLWDAFHYSKSQLLPFMFAANRTVYARFMPYMVLQMNRVPDAVLKAFKKGKFVAKLTKGAFNSVWIDYFLEVTENKALKSSGGIIGLTHNDSALSRWFLSRPVTAKYAVEFSSAGKIPSGKHHTDTPFHTSAYNEAVRNMLSLFENQIFIDPFCLSEPPARLVNFATGVAAEPEVARSLLNCHSTGKSMLTEFVRSRFQVEGEPAPKKNFFDPIPRANIKTMSSTKAGTIHIKAKDVTINGEEMYLRLLAINAYKKVPLERVMSFENAPVPLSLFHDDCSMTSTKKSDFLEKLEQLVEPKNILRSVQRVDCIVFDGMAIIQLLQPPTGSKPTYKQMADSFWAYIISGCQQTTQVHVVFDRYVENSLKNQTRKKRGESESSSIITIQPNMVIGDWKRILTSSKCKNELTKMYTRHLTENCHTLIADGIQLFVAGGLQQKALLVTNKSVSYIDNLESNQEEADSRMLFHLAHASASFGITSATVVSPDTDVFVLLVHHYNSLGIDTVFFKTGRKGLHCNLTRFIPVHLVYRALTPDERTIVLPIYCITGCDTCSSFHGIGKKKAFQVLRRHSQQLTSLADLGQLPELSSTTKAAAFLFVGLLYGKNSCTSLNILRKDLVLGKARVKPRRLPPTNDSMMMHLLRCAYQLFIWRNALNPQAEPDPLECGYVTDNNGLYSPHLMSQPCAPPELLSDMVCACDNHCSEECVCQENEQPCTTACSCKSMLQDSDDICQNLFTMLASVSEDDDIEDDS